jgi:4-amino-4-deoxy-L-arabinose transferase-like glycosyltransferase
MLIVVVLAAAGFLYTRALPAAAHYDEGVYLASVDGLRHGQSLGDEIFTPQPPGFYRLVAGLEVVFGDSLRDVRRAAIAIALVGLLAAYGLGRAAAGRTGGLAAAAVLAVAPPFPEFAARVYADLPALVLALLALCAVAYGRRMPGRAGAALAALAGALAAYAVDVKLSALTVAAPLAAFLAIGPERLRRLGLAAAGAVAVGIVELLASRDRLDGIWRGAVTYHEDARHVSGRPGLADNLERVAEFLDPRTPFAWLVAAAALAAVVRRGRPLSLPVWPLWLWTGVAAVFLVWHRPLHDNHMILLVIALAIPAGIELAAAGRRLPPRAALVAGSAVVLALAAAFGQEHRRLVRNQSDEPPGVVWAARQLRLRTTPAELVVVDRPIVALLADRRVPGELVDAAALRFDAGHLSSAEVLAEIDRLGVRAVVAAREFRHHPDLLRGLGERFPTRLRYADVTLFAREAAST